VARRRAEDGEGGEPSGGGAAPAESRKAGPGDADSARWEVPVTVRRGEDGFDFGGPFVGGDRTDRNLGLA
jgi:Family of unknown function (DUF5990)